MEQVLALSMQLSGRGSQEQRSIGTSFAPLQAMMNDGEIGVEQNEAGKASKAGTAGKAGIAARQAGQVRTGQAGK